MTFFGWSLICSPANHDRQPLTSVLGETTPQRSAHPVGRVRETNSIQHLLSLEHSKLADRDLLVISFQLLQGSPQSVAPKRSPRRKPRAVPPRRLLKCGQLRFMGTARLDGPHRCRAAVVWVVGVWPVGLGGSEGI